MVAQLVNSPFPTVKNLSFHYPYCIYNGLPLDHVLSQINPSTPNRPLSQSPYLLSFHLRLGLPSGVFPPGFPRCLRLKSSGRLPRRQLSYKTFSQQRRYVSPMDGHSTSLDDEGNKDKICLGHDLVILSNCFL